MFELFVKPCYALGMKENPQLSQAVAIPLESAPVLKPEASQELIKRGRERFQPLKNNLGKIVRKMELILSRGERVLTLEGLKAKFNIQNASDLYRLNGDFEGEYAKDIIRSFKKIGEGGKVVNIGAAQGFYTVYAALAGSNVTAIEPDPSSISALKKNIDLNNINDKVLIVPNALGEKEEEKSLFIDSHHRSAASFLNTDKQDSETKVQVLRLDQVIKENPDILVMDVEGYEERVLQGMGNLKPKEIFIEIHPRFLPNLNSSENSVKQLLSDYGYFLKKEELRNKELLCHFIKKED